MTLGFNLNRVFCIVIFRGTVVGIQNNDTFSGGMHCTGQNVSITLWSEQFGTGIEQQKCLPSLEWRRIQLLPILVPLPPLQSPNGLVSLCWFGWKCNSHKLFECSLVEMFS